MTGHASHAGSESPILGCRFCWMCRHVCPVGHVTARETFTPHAWAMLIDAVDARRGAVERRDRRRAVCLRRLRDVPDALQDRSASARRDCGGSRRHRARGCGAVDRRGTRCQAAAMGESRMRRPHRSRARPGDYGTLRRGMRRCIGSRGTVDAARALLAAAGATAAPIGVGRSTGLARECARASRNRRDARARNRRRGARQRLSRGARARPGRSVCVHAGLS